MTALNKQVIDFSQPLETENGEPVKYICHDVIEYKCARVCVDIATGVVYSSPYVGLKIRNKETTQRAKLREQIESAADVYWQFDNGRISDMKCGDLSHEYLLFVKDPKNVLALLDELEAAENELNACKSILEKIKSTSCHVDTSPGAFIPNSLDAWGRPVPQYLPYDFSGNPGVSATQYCNGWNDAGGYWLNHVKYLQECIRAAGIGVKGE